MVNYKKQKGSFVKHCPCSPEAVSCGYFNLNLHTGCPYSCSYCILQTYLESKESLFFTNLEDMEEELLRISKGKKHLRIGTGELADSLALDSEAHYSIKILMVFERFPDIVFEFKTKSANIKNVLEYKTVPKNIVISWSLNPEIIIKKEEHYTPDLATRLKAIGEIQSRGYKMGIHFDPIIIFKNWKSHYKGLIKEISRIIDPSKVVWWSLGALRFPYVLREHIFKYKNSILFEGELVKGYDGKYRYFKPLRSELFAFIKQQIRSLISESIPLYLCMEDREMWEEVLPEIEPREADINLYLYSQVFGT